MNKFAIGFNPPETDIALCGSMSHRQELNELISTLRSKGLTVSTPDLDAEPVDYSSLSDEQIRKTKGHFIRRHFANIAKAKIVLVANYEKNGVKGYIGGNTLLEMGAAVGLEKPLYVLNKISKQKNYEEILGLEPIVLDGNLDTLEAIK